MLKKKPWLKGFLVWQVYDFAFFVTTFEDVHVSNSIVADSGIGMFMQGHKVISWKYVNLSIVFIN